MPRVTHVNRKLIATMPILLVCGIVAQTILLVAVIVLYVPCLLWPDMLNGPYLWVTKGMARIFARSLIGRRSKAGMVQETVELSFRYRARPCRCLRTGASPWYNRVKINTIGGTQEWTGTLSSVSY